MCLAVPMKIKSVDGFAAVCEAKGIEREVSLFMLQGEEVAVGRPRAGARRLRHPEGERGGGAATWELFDEILEHA